MRNKIYNVLNKIYAISLTLAFFIGFLPVVPFIIAIIIGGQTGEAISLFMYNKVYPVAFITASFSVIAGLTAMYARGHKSMSVDSYGKKED